MTDSDRLDFLLKYLSIDDVGDDVICLGINVKGEKLADDLSFIKTWDDDLRDVIDRAIQRSTQ